MVYFQKTSWLDDLEENDFRRGNPRFREPYFENNRNLAAEIQYLAQERNVTATQLVLAWLLNRNKEMIPIPGTKRIKYLEENAAALNIVLSADELNTIESIAEKYNNTGEQY